MKILISLLLFAITHLIAADITLVPYIAKTSYDKVPKKSSLIGGIYANYIEDDYVIEMGYENLKLDYNSTSAVKDLNQDDFVLSYSQLVTPSKKIKGAFHYILSNNKQSDNAKVIFVDLQHFKKNKFDIGLELAYSSYDKSAVADDVRQAKLYYGMTFGDYKSTMGRYIVKIGATMISSEYTDSNSSLDTTLNSYDLSITQHKGNFTNKLTWWDGDRLNAVKDDAFTVQNLNELYTTGLTLSTKYAIDRDMGLIVSYSKESFLDLDVNIKDKSERFLFSFSYIFR